MKPNQESHAAVDDWIARYGGWNHRLPLEALNLTPIDEETGCTAEEIAAAS
jgi:hypothetical protein